jgi:type VI secretion system FHA domain protein
MLSLKLVRGAENADGVRLVVNVPPEAAKFVVGRDPSCDWPIADRQLALSARHFEILRVEGRQVLRDTSTNGTFVNGARARLPADHVLRHGDRITLGSYTLEVAVVPDALGSGAKAAAPAAAPAARRGGDPAAMVGADWEQAPVRAGAEAADVKTGFTRISKPPPKEVLEELLAATPAADAAAAAAAPAREAVRRAPPGTTDVLQRLAGGLGVPVEALGATDPAVAAERVARLLRVAVLALHRQMAAQARQLRELGSRAPVVLAKSEAARLRMAPGPEEAITALLGSGDEAEAVLVRAHSELGQHMQRLALAFGAAGERLGEQLAPAAIERIGQGSDDAARLWKIYGSLWTALGVGVGKRWEQGLAESLAAYLGAAYDDPKLMERAASGASSGAASGNASGTASEKAVR